MIFVSYFGKVQFAFDQDVHFQGVVKEIQQSDKFPFDYYLTLNGKILKDDDDVIEEGTIHIQPRLLGGKGGFGSMLRAIGAQIEKTTNREACRDLSGRRLRDINEEKRLKTWIAQQAEREKESEDKRLKKLERLCERPKHEFSDETYERERSALPEKIEDALEQGLKASTSNSAGKRKLGKDNNDKANKKTRLWMDPEELSLSEDSDEESDTNEEKSVNSNISNSNSSEDVKIVENKNILMQEPEPLNEKHASEQDENDELMGWVDKKVN